MYGKEREIIPVPEKTIAVGQKVRFDPLQECTGFGAYGNRGHYVTGTVVMVNVPHRWFSVEYGKNKKRDSFKFSQIGEDVKIVG